MIPIIELKDVGVVYNQGKSNEMVALHDINLEIYEGEYIVFLGQSGCGKSTLLYTIAGLESATSGDVTVGGKNLRKISPKEKIEFYRNTIGMIFQAFYLVSHLTAEDNIILPKIFSKSSLSDRKEKARTLMERFGISSYADRKPSMMSGGQQQRTAIARALMNDPMIILADEPVGNLDSKNSKIVLELLADIHKNEHKTIIQVTHNANDAHYADRVFYMKDGAIERVVVNTEKDKQAGGDGSELSQLSQMYPSLPQSEIRAMLVMRQILVPYSIDTEHKIVKIIERYLKKEIDRAQLASLLDDSHKGAGMYSQKASSVASDVERISKEMDSVHPLAEQVGDDRAVSMIGYLLERYKGHISLDQRTALSLHISERLSGKLDSKGFMEILDRPISRGGIGLNSRTASHFSEEVELIITQNN